MEIEIMRMEDEIKMDLAALPSWIKFLLYWYFRWRYPEERRDLDQIFDK